MNGYKKEAQPSQSFRFRDIQGKRFLANLYIYSLSTVKDTVLIAIHILKMGLADHRRRGPVVKHKLFYEYQFDEGVPLSEGGWTIEREDKEGIRATPQDDYLNYHVTDMKERNVWFKSYINKPLRPKFGASVAFRVRANVIEGEESKFTMPGGVILRFAEGIARYTYFDVRFNPLGGSTIKPDSVWHEIEIVYTEESTVLFEDDVCVFKWNHANDTVIQTTFDMQNLTRGTNLSFDVGNIQHHPTMWGRYRLNFVRKDPQHFAHAEEGLHLLAEWFPEEKDKLLGNKSEILFNALQGIEPHETSALHELEHSESAVVERASRAVFTPCQEAIGIVAVDAVLLVLGFVGLRVSNQERLARALLRELGENTLNGFRRSVAAIKDAKNITEKAKAIFSLLSGVFKAGGFKAVFKEIKDEMSWWEWTKTGVIATGQILAWFATGGAAFIGEVLLNASSVVQTVQDSIRASQVCG